MAYKNRSLIDFLLWMGIDPKIPPSVWPLIVSITDRQNHVLTVNPGKETEIQIVLYSELTEQENDIINSMMHKEITYVEKRKGHLLFRINTQYRD